MAKEQETRYLVAVIERGTFSHYTFFGHRPDGKLNEYGTQYIFVKEVEVETEVPEDFDWRGPAIEKAQESRKEFMAHAQGYVTKIEGWISNMLALEAPRVIVAGGTDDDIPF